MKATYTKLKSGEWGVKVEGDVGETTNAARLGAVKVAKKDGSVKEQRLGKQVWESPDHTVRIFATESSGTATAPTTRRPYGVRTESDYCRCRWCGKKTRSGDDWCDCCGRANYE